MHESSARLIAFASMALLITACSDGDLRGSSERSKDGGTYLVVADDNGGQCGPLLVDGKPWGYRIGEPGPIAPGVHQIFCGVGSAFDVKSGTVYRFDYWGP
ncbi:hypothetical protein LVB87_05785 [Lysobacter sp. KIS68-7]|uniref:hypothetical protein n=1 Tax=Lysobacter sp. KIS68-7 TaxID=2904252 RepID=UPI001E2EEAF4|nr:hypothetical protein [Lysobacter sp. KIS68-7]UHQ20652.1 hypothetical protein LVB87_05785 [Lysobacter sp. KIS68-7]